jgi:hypothetical protein
MSGGFWAGHGWVLVEIGCGGALCVLLGWWFGGLGKDRAYDRGYDDCDADRAEAALELAKRSVATLAQIHPAEVAHEELVSPAGYMMGYRLSVNGQEVYDWAHDDPEGTAFSPEAAREALEEWAVPLEYPPEDVGEATALRVQAGAATDPQRSTDRSLRVGNPLALAHPAYAWEPWSLSEGTTLEEEVRAMCANADAAPSVRWLAALETGQ